MILLLALHALAAPTSVGEVWTSFGVEARVHDDFRVELGQNIRVGTGEDGVVEVLTDVGGQWRLHKRVDLAATYRLGPKGSDGEPLAFYHRANVDGKWEIKAAKWLDLDNRLRYQVRLPTRDKGPKHVVRTRVRASLDLDHDIEPRFGVEAFLGLGDGDGTGDGLGVPKLRFDVGARYGRKHYDLDVYYRHEEPVRDRDDPRLHVLVVGLTTGLDLRRDDD